MKLLLCSQTECQLALGQIAALKSLGIRGFISSSADGYLLMLAKGVKAVEYLRFDSPRFLPAYASNWADHSARLLDHEISEIRFTNDSRQAVKGWEYQHKLGFAYPYILLKALLEYVNHKSLPSELVMFDCPSPFSIQRSYSTWILWKSFLLANGKSLRFIKLNESKQGWRMRLDIPSDLDWQNIEALVSVPATYYDSPRLRKRFQHTKAVDLESPLYDVMICENRIALIQESDSNYINNYLGSLQSKLVAAYKDFLSVIYKDDLTVANEELLKSWLGRAGFQSGVLELLFGIKDPKNLKCVIISEVCGGLQAPLLAFSKSRGLAVEVVPHSSYVHRPIDLNLNVNINSTLSFRSAYHSLSLCRKAVVLNRSVHDISSDEGEHVENKKKKYHIGILMNQLDNTAGVSLTDPKVLFQFLAVLTHALKEQGLTYAVRTKPDHEYILRFFDKDIVTDSNRSGLDEFIESTAVILSLLQPTNAMNRAWELGKTCIHIQNTAMTVMDIGHMPVPDGRVVIFDSGLGPETIRKTLRELVNFSPRLGAT